MSFPLWSPEEAAPPRVVIEGLEPQVDGGRFPAKRIAGDTVTVGADVFADGHDTLSVIVRYRGVAREGPAAEPWRESPMEALGNDRWIGRFRVDTPGLYEFTVAGWVDRFASWRHELSKKVDAGLDVTSELLEGAALVRQTAADLRTAGAVTSGPPEAGTEGADAGWLEARADLLAGTLPQAERAAAALADDVGARMAAADGRRGLAAHPPLRLLVERERARFGAWYEMFPRSAGPDPTRSATFDEAATRLPAVADMGFDVVYLPPIHPIGVSFRKGPNNSLTASPGDPGSPWAIGNADGGHMAVEPGLGTIEDFDRFVETARRLGLEIALDIAYQCSPDHPYVGTHPSWFRHRPDGTIKYAENPPKKYQDIYPLDFETDDWRALWEELRAVILFWVDHGVTIFRVDNPHTKPFAFWEWMIQDVRRVHPGTIFLSEAFTRPKIMKRLAKLGFSQSYTYFTWRNTKADLTEYFTELTGTSVREYLRPNLFANTPDILHAYLQTGGRAAFQARLVLAATLGANYGIYSGFELCEGRAVRPGSEEYLDSEKYQYKQWDWDRPGHIRELVARVNAIRHEEPALQSDWSLRFHATDNPSILAYSKETSDAAICAVVNLDPHWLQHGWVQLPLKEWGLDPAGYRVHDLLTDERFDWQGEWNYVRLEPTARVAHIIRIEKAVR